MKYTHLSIDDTNIWLDNIIKTLELIKLTLQKSIDIETNIKHEILNYYHKNKYCKFFSKLIYGLYDSEDICIGYSTGICFTINGLMNDLNFRLSEEQRNFRLFCKDIMDEDEISFVVELNRTWSTYADKPFEINETDVLNYFRVMKIHDLCKNALLSIGAYNETYDLVEDSRSSC
ncbi:hypothetical protein N0S44_000463 [Escherichia coli]|uniref:hypothetical protein n=1 Tax=Escherichia coli TaxID=562 RepID=UPI0039BF2DFB|nr:hypothetical protein [Escherichia coli]EJR1979308.1 hypothetical protein [Escherichia coli]